MTTLPTVRLSLWRAEAVVLFDWLMSVDEGAVPVTHPAQKQALRDLLTRLEVETDSRTRPSMIGDVEAAPREVAGDMKG